jgi:putative ABC transport system permease protein
VPVVSTTFAVGVLVSMLSMGAGVQTTVAQSARADRAWVLSRGAQSMFTSALSKDAVRTITDMPGIKRDADGKEIVSVHVIVPIEGMKKKDNARVSFPLIGVGEKFPIAYPEFHLTGGRMFRPGVHELIAGKTRHESLKNLEIGDRIRLRGGDWIVVGHFAAGAAFDSSLIADTETVISAFRNATPNTVTVMLESSDAFSQMQTFIGSIPSIDADLKHDTEVMQAQFAQVTGLLDFVSYVVGAVMAVGATLGATNAMYAIMEGRTREIATLRAIGFGVGPIIISVLTETMILAVLGALLGAVIAWLLFNGHAINPVGISLTLSVTPGVVALGIGWAVAMGLIGGLLPTIRATSVSVTDGLRSI